MTLSVEHLKRYIIDNFDLDDEEADPENKLFSSGLLDSLTMMELITYIESECQFRFKALDINLLNLDTINSMVAYIDSRV